MTDKFDNNMSNAIIFATFLIIFRKFCGLKLVLYKSQKIIEKSKELYIIRFIGIAVSTFKRILIMINMASNSTYILEPEILGSRNINFS